MGRSCKGCPGWSLGAQSDRVTAKTEMDLGQSGSTSAQMALSVWETNYRVSNSLVTRYPSSYDSAGQEAAVTQKRVATLGFLPEPQKHSGRDAGGAGMTGGGSLTAAAPAVQAFRFTIMAGCVLTMVSSIRSLMVDRSTLPSFFSPQFKRKCRKVISRQMHFLLIQLQLPLKPLRRYSPSPGNNHPGIFPHPVLTLPST